MDKLRLPSYFEVRNIKYLNNGENIPITDFALLNHAYNFGKSKKSGIYWTESIDEGGYIYCMGVNCNDSYCYEGNNLFISILPITSYDTLNMQPKIEDGYKVVEYGYYPQSVASKDIQKELNKNKLASTGNTYTILREVKTLDNDLNVIKRSIKKLSLNEFEYKGKRYIKKRADFYQSDTYLSDRHLHLNNREVWVNVEPVKWIVDEENKLLISKYMLLSGIPYDFAKQYNGTYEDSFICKFINEYMAIDMFRNIDMNNILVNNKEFESINNRMNDIRKRIKTIHRK